MIKDIPGIAHLVRRVYEDMPAYTHGEIRGQINNFKEGCFVALLDYEVVGYCATMQLAQALAEAAAAQELSSTCTVAIFRTP